MPTFRPLSLYLFGTGSWFAAFGMQSVIFTWLVTMVLNQPGEMVGLAQMSLLAPGLLLMLVGGSYADRLGANRVAAWAQGAAALTPLILVAALLQDALSFSVMLAYAVCMGTAQAFVTPARDGLLSHVASGRVQRTVMLTSVCQFGMQIVGFVIASFADSFGAVAILATQCVVLMIGAVGLHSIPLAAPEKAAVPVSLARQVMTGARTVFGNTTMRLLFVQNIAMGVFFMGSFIVTLPLIIRDVYAGSSFDLGMLNGLNSLGLVLTILLLLRLGQVERSGRALLVSQGVGCLFLGAAGLVDNLTAVYLLIFCWGLCGGMAMTMSRSIMQEQAPPDQRGRVMSFYGLSFMGSGPAGALLSGYMSGAFGPQIALVISASGMLLYVLCVVNTALWQVSSDHGDVPVAPAVPAGSENGTATVIPGNSP